MTDFRKADISKQESYDLLRDWIKLVARHTNPDQDISELLGWLWKLKPATPDPATGLVPCGCGGKARLLRKPIGNWVDHKIACDSCTMETAWVAGEDSADKAKIEWNTAMGWRADE